MSRIERLVLHGRQRDWLAYLHGVVGLIERAPAPTTRSGTRSHAGDAVFANHHNLLLALPGRARSDRQRPGAAAQLAEDQTTTNHQGTHEHDDIRPRPAD